MKKITVKLTTGCMMLLAGAALSGCALRFWNKTDDPAQVAFSTIPSGGYQRIADLADDRRQPVQCALIRSHSDWNHWFAPTDVTPGQLAMMPTDEYFEMRQLLLVSRVIQAPDSIERGRIFTADKVSMRDGVLRLAYRFVRPASGATYQVRDFLLVEIPRDRYTTGPVQFIENGEQVCQIAR